MADLPAAGNWWKLTLLPGRLLDRGGKHPGKRSPLGGNATADEEKNYKGELVEASRLW